MSGVIAHFLNLHQPIILMLIQEYIATTSILSVPERTIDEEVGRLHASRTGKAIDEAVGHEWPTCFIYISLSVTITEGAHLYYVYICPCRRGNK